MSPAKFTEPQVGRCRSDMKHKRVVPHASIHSSLRVNERPSEQAGDPGPQVGKHDPKSLQKPGAPDPRVAASEANEARTR